jgi:hypothetical protein
MTVKANGLYVIRVPVNIEGIKVNSTTNILATTYETGSYVRYLIQITYKV